MVYREGQFRDSLFSNALRDRPLREPVRRCVRASAVRCIRHAWHPQERAHWA